MKIKDNKNIYTYEELQIIKEFLLEEMGLITKDLCNHEDKAVMAKFKPFIMQIFKQELENRNLFLQNLLDKVLSKQKNLKNL